MDFSFGDAASLRPARLGYDADTGLHAELRRVAASSVVHTGQLVMLERENELLRSRVAAMSAQPAPAPLSAAAAYASQPRAAGYASSAGWLQAAPEATSNAGLVNTVLVEQLTAAVNALHAATVANQQLREVVESRLPEPAPATAVPSTVVARRPPPVPPQPFRLSDNATVQQSDMAVPGVSGAGPTSTSSASDAGPVDSAQLLGQFFTRLLSDHAHKTATPDPVEHTRRYTGGPSGAEKDAAAQALQALQDALENAREHLPLNALMQPQPAAAEQQPGEDTGPSGRASMSPRRRVLSPSKPLSVQPGKPAFGSSAPVGRTPTVATCASDLSPRSPNGKRISSVTAMRLQRSGVPLPSAAAPEPARASLSPNPRVSLAQMQQQPVQQQQDQPRPMPPLHEIQHRLAMSSSRAASAVPVTPSHEAAGLPSSVRPVSPPGRVSSAKPAVAEPSQPDESFSQQSVTDLLRAVRATGAKLTSLRQRDADASHAAAAPEAPGGFSALPSSLQWHPATRSATDRGRSRSPSHVRSAAAAVLPSLADLEWQPSAAASSSRSPLATFAATPIPQYELRPYPSASSGGDMPSGTWAASGNPSTPPPASLPQWRPQAAHVAEQAQQEVPLAAVEPRSLRFRFTDDASDRPQQLQAAAGGKAFMTDDDDDASIARVAALTRQLAQYSLTQRAPAAAIAPMPTSRSNIAALHKPHTLEKESKTLEAVAPSAARAKPTASHATRSSSSFSSGATADKASTSPRSPVPSTQRASSGDRPLDWQTFRAALSGPSSSSSSRITSEPALQQSPPAVTSARRQAALSPYASPRSAGSAEEAQEPRWRLLGTDPELRMGPGWQEVDARGDSEALQALSPSAATSAAAQYVRSPSSHHSPSPRHARGSPMSVRFSDAAPYTAAAAAAGHRAIDAVVAHLAADAPTARHGAASASGPPSGANGAQAIMAQLDNVLLRLTFDHDV